MPVIRNLLIVPALSVPLFLAGCGGGDDGSDSSGPTTGAPSVAARATATGPTAQCPAGGVQVATGIDENRNGVLDDDEIDDTAVVCNGRMAQQARTGWTATLA